MYKYVIKGGKPLEGRVRISGAKNAALPILAATILIDEPVILHNVPMLDDVFTMIELLRKLGKEIDFQNDGTVVIKTVDTEPYEAEYTLVKKMRASIAVLGPLVAKRKKAKVSFPGGCAIGPRPVDLHIKGISALSADISIEQGYIFATVKDGKLKGNRIDLLGSRGPSVLATENVMMAAVLAEGETIIENSAKEPEVVDTANFLKKAGAIIEGEGTSTIKIRGVEELHGVEYTIIPDRIEAGTFMVASAITHGEVILENVYVHHLETPIKVLQEIGAKVDILDEHTIKVSGKNVDRYKATVIETLPYPGFPTDLQAQYMALLTVADGTSLIIENIFPNRFLHALELQRMGANIELRDNLAIVHGIERLSGATVMVSDLRAGAGLVLAALQTPDVSEILRIYHIDRGYEALEQKLQQLGAEIERKKSDII